MENKREKVYKRGKAYESKRKENCIAVKERESVQENKSGEVYGSKSEVKCLGVKERKSV